MALDASRRVPEEIGHDGDGGRIAEDLFHEHAARVYSYCRSQLASREDAEDAVQATFLAACRSLNAGFRPRIPVAWLLWIAANVCRKRHRSRFRLRRREWLGDPEALEEILPAAENPHEELFGLSHALERLPERQRRALVRREWQGLSYDEIAAELDVSHSAIETLLFRARRSLKAALERPEDGRRRRRLRALDVGSLAAGLKSLLAGSTGGKVAVGAAVVATATTAALVPLQWDRERASRPAAAKAREASPPASPIVSEAVSAPWSDPVPERARVKALQKALRLSDARRRAPASRPRRQATRSVPASASPTAPGVSSPTSPAAAEPAQEPSASPPPPAPETPSPPPAPAPSPPPAEATPDPADEEPGAKAKGRKKPKKPKKPKAKKEKPKAEKVKLKPDVAGKEAKAPVEVAGAE